MERVAARVATPPSLTFKGSNMAALAMLIKDDPPGTGGGGAGPRRSFTCSPIECGCSQGQRSASSAVHDITRGRPRFLFPRTSEVQRSWRREGAAAAPARSIHENNRGVPATSTAKASMLASDARDRMSSPASACRGRCLLASPVPAFLLACCYVSRLMQNSSNPGWRG